MNTSSSALPPHMSSAPPIKVPPLISTSASIWAPKPYALSQHHSWPEQVAAWTSAMPGHPPSQSQVLHERTNMYEQRNSGVPLGPMGKLNDQNALVADRERRQRVGAIGDGRQNGSGPAPSMVRLSLHTQLPPRVFRHSLLRTRSYSSDIAFYFGKSRHLSDRNSRAISTSTYLAP